MERMSDYKNTKGGQECEGQILSGIHAAAHVCLSENRYRKVSKIETNYEFIYFNLSPRCPPTPHTHILYSNL